MRGTSIRVQVLDDAPQERASAAADFGLSHWVPLECYLELSLLTAARVELGFCKR